MQRTLSPSTLLTSMLFATVFLGFMFLSAPFAHAAITEVGPPMAGFYGQANAGGGSIVTLAKFRVRGDGTTALGKVGLQLRASSTMDTLTQLDGIGLYREANNRNDFQISGDTMVGTAYLANPATSTLLLLQIGGSGYTPSSTMDTEFYIVASTSAAANIINGNAFDVILQTNYASTTGATPAGFGTAFMSPGKLTLDQGSPIVVSEIQQGGSGSTLDEFIELYNRSDYAIDVSKLPLSLYLMNSSGTAGLKALTYNKRIIPRFGYFLIAADSLYSGSVEPDATYAVTSGNTIVANGAYALATSSTVTNATSTAFDRAGWDTHPAADCRAVLCFNPTGGADFATTGSLERKASENSTAATMVQFGGSEGFKGNGFASTTAGNAIEFVIQTTSNPQNSSSPEEFPFSGFGAPGGGGGGGGASDTTSPSVLDSFPRNGDTNVPIDRRDIGFSFSEPVQSGTIQSGTATTTVTLTAPGSSTNLCTSVTYNPGGSPQVRCMLSASLSPSTTYTFTVATTTFDFSNNRLDQNSFEAGSQPYLITFTTGAAGFTQTNITPPSVIGTSPFSGSQNISRNIAKISIEFNQLGMLISSLNSTNITLTGGGSSITLSAFSLATSTGRAMLTATLGSTLTADTEYTLSVGTGVKSDQNIPLPMAYTAKFRTGNSSDTSAPTVLGILPTPGTTIAAGTADFLFTFDDTMDGTTATSGAVTLSTDLGNVPGSVEYMPISKEGRFVPSSVLPLNKTLTLTLVGASLKNAAGVALGADRTYTWTTESSNSDSVAPSIQFARATDFELSVAYNEPVKESDATNLDNYSLTAGGASVSLSGLAGQTVRYNATDRTARISGVKLTSGQSFTITASNIRDLSGNKSGAITFTATVEGFQQAGASFGTTGGFSGSTFGEVKDFSASGIGFMPSVGVKPLNTFISASSTYVFDLPLAKQIPANGTVVITFPSGSDFGLCCVATTSTKDPFLREQNKDINGPGTGTIGVKTITKNAAARTVTLTLDTATRSESGDTHDFLHFGLADLKNPSIPKSIDSSGYSLDIKSKNASGELLESFSANPVYISGGSVGGGATTTVRGVVSGNGGVIIGANVYLDSPQTGPLSTVSGAAGVYSFSNVPVNSQFLSNNFGGGGEYYLRTDALIDSSTITDANGATSTSFFGDGMPTPVRATSTSIITRNFALSSATGGISFVVKVTAAASTFGASDEVDIFAGGPGRFVVKTATPGTGALSASTLATLPIPAVNGRWGIGIGPAMPKGGSSFGGPPPATNWSTPKPIELNVTGCPSACTAEVNGASATTYTFTVATADKTIAGILKDASGNAIANAMVYAFSPTLGSGGQTQSATNGTFSLKVVSGDFNVGAFVPGMPSSRQTPVVVKSDGTVYVDGSATASTGSSGANPFTLKMTKPGYTITGQVTDGTNPVGNAPVFAYRTDAPGHADAKTDSSTGNYTIYVDNGTWKVNSYIPGFGPMTEQTVTVASANQSSINFSPSASANFSILSGNIYEDANSGGSFTAGEGIQGAVIRISGASGQNEGISGDDGAYSIRVPSGSGYTISEIFKPGYGRIPALDDAGAAIGSINLTASTTKSIRVATRRTVTVNIKDSDGNKLVIPKAFIDFFDVTTGMSNKVELSNSSSTSISLADGASTTIRAFVEGVPQSLISVASDDAVNTSVISGVLKVNGTETVKIVMNTSSASLSTVSGTVYHTSATSGNELDNAWIQFTDATNNIFFGTQATSSGKYSIKVAAGTYQVFASKPGYIGTPTSVTVSGSATSQNFVLSAASLTISGQVTAGGSAAKNAFVRAAKVGGGQAVAQTDTSGNYSLQVTDGVWRIFATAEGYAEGAHSGNPITVSGSSLTGKNIALSTTVSLQSKLATSNTFTDTSAGTFTDSTVNVGVQIDANAFGSSGNSSYFTARETSNIPNTDSITVVASKAKEISAYSGDSQVTSLQSGKSAAVDLTYTKAELASSGIDTTSEVEALTVSTYKETLKEWKALTTVETYLDASGNAIASPAANLSDVATVKFTATTDTFSAFALTAAVGASPPGTPSGLTATNASVQGTPKVTLAWTASTNSPEGYYLYRSTDNSSFPLLADAGNVTSYTDSSGLTANTKYYYQVSGYKSSGAQESAASSAVEVTTTLNIGGGGVVSSGGGGGGGAPSRTVTPTTSTTTPATVAATTLVTTAGSAKSAAGATPSTVSAAPSASAVAAGKAAAVFTQPLFNGVRSSQVAALQRLLNADPDTRVALSGAGASGNETTLLGPLTVRAIQKFQIKYGLAAPGDSGYGFVGPKTRAKLNELATGDAKPVVMPSVSLSVQTKAPSALTPAMRLAIVDQIMVLLEKARELQAELDKMQGR